MLKDIVEEVYQKIEEFNSKTDIDSIPHSDLFKKAILSTIGIQENQLQKILHILKDSHKIFIFEIVKEDKSHDIQKTEGYVITEIDTIRRLKNYFQHLLMSEYEKQFKTRLLVHQIVKEIYQGSRSFKNTPIGQIANKAIMLEEFENLIEKEFSQYLDEWKENMLAEILQKEEKEFNKDAQKDSESAADSLTKDGESQKSSRRAVDSEEFNQISSLENKQSLKKVLSIYGVEFFFRVNLRRYNFEIIQNAIETKEIDRKADLKLLKDMIQKVKSNIKIDTKLQDYTAELYKLERTVSRHMISRAK